jgi:hypothetical protein
MAITVAQLADEGNVSLGAYPTSVVDITGDTSYPTGGYTSALGLSANNLNCGRGINGMSPLGTNTAAEGFLAVYNTQTGTLQIFESAGSAAALSELANATNVSTYTFRFLVIGQR